MQTRSRLGLIGPAVALAFLVAACSSAATPTPPSSTPAATTPAAATPAAATPEPTGGAPGNAVEIRSFAFNPAELTVAKGTTVTFANQDGAAHTATADDGSTFDSGRLSTGASFSFTFDTPGTFAYHCAIHPDMKATITVTP